jgi:thiamine-phosphate pyrophosphorylase
MRQRLGSDVTIGISAHSLESAIEAVTEYAPDYLFVGTCYKTTSHPEKSKADLEGPALPGQVQRAVTSIPVFAIGGIDETNCHEPVLRYGAHGVAVIRAVLRSSDPAQAVIQIHNNMIRKP